MPKDDEPEASLQGIVRQRSRVKKEGRRGRNFVRRKTLLVARMREKKSHHQHGTPPQTKTKSSVPVKEDPTTSREKRKETEGLAEGEGLTLDLKKVFAYGFFLAVGEKRGAPPAAPGKRGGKSVIRHGKNAG